MASRDKTAREKLNAFDFCVLEILLIKQGETAGIKDRMRLVTIDNHLETLRFVEQNLDACISTIVKLQRMEEKAQGANRHGLTPGLG